MGNQSAGGVPCWYVVRTHLRQEERAASNLTVLGAEILAPKIKAARHNQYTNIATCSTKPLFPSYIFAKFKIDGLYHKIRFTRGVRDLVSINGAPAPIDEAVIDMIRSRIREDGFVRLGEDFKPGDKVVIKAGPLKNFSGVFEREVKDSDRVRILLETVRYQAHVEIGRYLVEKFHKPR